MKDKSFIRNIFILSLIVTILFPLINIYLIYPSFTRLLISKTEADAEHIAQHIKGMFIPENIKLTEDTASNIFTNKIEKLKKDFNFIKLKLFSRTGETLYSTDPKDIGVMNTKKYFYENVAKGNNYSMIVQKDTKSLEGQTVSADVVETYVPIMSDGRFKGAFEIYYDITLGYQKLKNILYWATIIPCIFMFSFFVAVVVFIIRAEKKETDELQDKKFAEDYLSPYHFLFFLAFSIFVAEAFVMLLLANLPPISSLTEAILNSSLLVMLVSPVIYLLLVRPLMQHITERKEHEYKINRNYNIQGAISSILQTSLKPISLKEMLERSLDIILFVPFFSGLNKGAIFLAEDNGDTLKMEVQRGLAEPMQTTCATVPFGRCLCGRAASTHETIFVDHLDENHENSYDGITPHGHYCVPILSSNKVLGVINIYIPEGHRWKPDEQQFLTMVADTLAGTIKHRQP